MKIRYIISSHVQYAPLTLPLLLDSMGSIDPANIFIAVGGSPVTFIEQRKGTTIAYVEHNSFDYTGVIEILERDLHADWWFWLHDTCRCGPRFRELVENNFDPTKELTAVHLHVGGCNMCNFGLYSGELLNKHKEYFIGLKNISKQQAIEHEGHLARSGWATTAVYPHGEYEELGRQDVYGNGLERLVEYYPGVDLYKYKANWGQTYQGAYNLSP